MRARCREGAKERDWNREGETPRQRENIDARGKYTVLFYMVQHQLINNLPGSKYVHNLSCG